MHTVTMWLFRLNECAIVSLWRNAVVVMASYTEFTRGLGLKCVRAAASAARLWVHKILDVYLLLDSLLLQVNVILTPRSSAALKLQGSFNGVESYLYTLQWQQQRSSRGGAELCCSVCCLLLRWQAPLAEWLQKYVNQMSKKKILCRDTIIHLSSHASWEVSASWNRIRYRDGSHSSNIIAHQHTFIKWYVIEVQITKHCQ